MTPSPCRTCVDTVTPCPCPRFLAWDWATNPDPPDRECLTCVDAEVLTLSGELPDQVAARLGMTRQGLDRHLREHGQGSLAQRGEHRDPDTTREPGPLPGRLGRDQPRDQGARRLALWVPGECGRGSDHLGPDPIEREDLHATRCVNHHGLPAHGTGSPVVLTTAHLNHTPEDCRPENLRAMCQGCHLHYDREHHAQSRAETQRRAAEDHGQGVLPW